MRGVINFFLCFRSKLTTDEVVLHGAILLVSKICSQNVHFHDSFWREQTLAARKLFLSLLTRIDFAVAFLVGPYVFFRPYHFDAYGPHTGPFLLWFSKEIACGAVRSYDKYSYCAVRRSLPYFSPFVEFPKMNLYNLNICKNNNTRLQR